MVNKYKPKKRTTNVYLCLIGIAALLSIIHWANVFNPNIFVINKYIDSHISNFSLSLLFYLAIGYVWILQGVTFWKIIVLGFLIMLSNVVCETMMGFMNTQDIADALFGIVGTFVSFCFLLATKKYGLDIHES